MSYTFLLLKFFIYIYKVLNASGQFTDGNASTRTTDNELTQTNLIIGWTSNGQMIKGKGS